MIFNDANVNVKYISGGSIRESVRRDQLEIHWFESCGSNLLPRGEKYSLRRTTPGDRKLNESIGDYFVMRWLVRCGILFNHLRNIYYFIAN